MSECTRATRHEGKRGLHGKLRKSKSMSMRNKEICFIRHGAVVPRREKKKTKNRGHAVMTSHRSTTCVHSVLSSVSNFPTGYIPAHSPTSPTSTLRATRAHDADLLIILSYPFAVPPWARHRDSRGYFCIQCLILLRGEPCKNETFWAYSDPRGFRG